MPPPVLFHYCNQEGVLGIIGSKEIWASNILYLNDAAEFNYTVDVMRNQASELKQSLPAEDHPCLDYLVDSADSSIGPLYLFSLSENGDLLSQWRGYCPTGAGYSIGFDPDRLEAIAHPQGFRLHPCIYDSGEQNAIVRKWFEDALPIYRDHPNASRLSLGTLIYQHFVHQFWAFAPRIKHPSYSEEKEWRLVSEVTAFPPSGLEMVNGHLEHGPIPPWLFFRKGKSMLVPYTKIRFTEMDKRLIPRIIVGPTSYPELSRLSMEGLAGVNGLQGSEIVNSVIPYRPSTFSLGIEI